MRLSAPTDALGSFRLIDNELGGVRKLIEEQLVAPAGAKAVGRLFKHINACRGKMIRPALLLLAGAACGKITDKHIRVAAIVEMMHDATLLHDDVIDEGQKRRGLPTVNSLWGNESAVLLGDFLLSRVFKMCADLEPHLTRIIADTASRTCQGELRQISLRNRGWRVDEAEYIDIITEKSAVFFSNCCYLGGLLAGAGRVQLRSLTDFGRNVGIAFQIADDLLDITGDENKTGKTTGSDADKKKLTLSVIHLLRTIDTRRKDAVKRRLNASGKSKDALAKMLSRSGSLRYAAGRAQEFVCKAIESLAVLKESDAKNALIETARFAADRAVIS